MDILNDDELVAIIGHEIGHVKYQHTLNRGKKASIASVAKQGLIIYGGKSVSSFTNSYGNTGEAIVNAQFSQSDELESDALGVRLLHSLGRSPYAAADAQRKMRAVGATGGGFFASHPSSSERIKKATEMADAITRQ